MKTKIFSLCALVAAVGLTSCNNDPGTDKGDGSLDILLNSALNVTTKGPVSKAPVTTSAWTYIAGWEFAQQGNTYVENYETNPTWISGGLVQVRVDANTDYPITLEPVQQYNADGTTRTYIKGWYPAGEGVDSLTIATGDEDNTVTGNISGSIKLADEDAPDGTVDVLYATAIYGDATNRISDPLVFNHMTTQIKFEVVGTEGLNPAAELTALTLTGARGPISLDLTGDSVVWNTKPQEFELLGADAVVVPHADSAAVAVGQPLMVKPEAMGVLKIDAMVDVDGDGGKAPKEYSDEVLTPGNMAAFMQGYAYTIRLRVSENGIELDGYIVDWISGGTSNVDLF